jgi:hypothetical protein
VGGVGVSGLVGGLVGLSGVERLGFVLDVVRVEVAGVLGFVGGGGVGEGVAFRELGFDSLTAVELRNRLVVRTGLRLAVTVVFDYPTPVALAGFLLAELDPDTDTGANVSEADEKALRTLLASLPLSRFREAGVLDALMRLAQMTPPDPAPAVPDESRSIDAMDVEELVERALND